MSLHARPLLGRQVGNLIVFLFYFFICFIVILFTFVVVFLFLFLFFLILTILPWLIIADSRYTKSNLNFVEVRDLNRIL